MNAPHPTPLDLLRRYRGVAALVAAAIFLRLSGLSEWWLNPDEGIYYSLITRASAEGFWHEVLSNAHPPLYYMILRGMGMLTWDFSILRAFSVLCGTATVAGVWAVAHCLASASEDAPIDGGGRADAGETRAIVAGFLAAFVVAFAPTSIEMSQVMRPYAFQASLLAWGLYFLLRYLQRPTGRRLAGYLTLLCLSLLTHYSSVLALGTFGILIGVEGWRRGLADGPWRKLVAWHLLPAGLLVALYFLHLRPLAASALADEALDGWLSYFMIRSPADVWLSFLGFQHHLAGPWLRAPLALALLGALGLAAYRRDMRVLALSAGVLIVAMTAATAGVYPFGSTRHSAWVTVFVVPVLGWFVASTFDGRSATTQRRILLAAAGVLALGGPMGALLGSEHVRWAPTERVLREAYLQAMLPELDPAADPELIVMSDQTFNLLLPFYPAEREAAVFSPDSSAFHFPFGQRTILVSRTWAFTSLENGEASTDLRAFLHKADEDFPSLGMRSRERFSFLDGGWGLPVSVQLQRTASSRSLVLSSRVVPGLHAFVLRTGALLDSGP